jgi:predicted DNA-binding antitoxin AbrB/MazE fold protein
MLIEVDAVYENGMLKPDVDFVQGLRRRLEDTAPAPGLEEVRRRLSKIPGSMTADFIAEREDR